MDDRSDWAWARMDERWENGCVSEWRDDTSTLDERVGKLGSVGI